MEIGDLYGLGAHRLLCGDALDDDNIKYLMHGEKAEMVFIDPPFFAIGNSIGTGNKSGSAETTMVKPFFRQIGRICADNLKPSHGAYICCDWRTYPAAFDGLAQEMKVCQCVVWDYTYMKMGVYLRSSHEFIIYVTNNRPNPNAYGIKKGEKLNPILMRTDLGNIWHIKDNIANSSKKLHPSQKPVEVAKTALTSYKDKVPDIVLDFFAGSGTVLIACEELGISCRCIEKDLEHCKTIIDRYERQTGKRAEKIGNIYE